MSSDEHIRDSAKSLRLNLAMSAILHRDKAQKCNELVAAINNFLGETKPKSTTSEKVEYCSAADAVRSVVSAFGDRPFSVDDVEKAMTTLKSSVLLDKAALRVTLWKMANQGELEIVERGTGRRPTTYRAKNLKIVRYRRTSK